VAASRFEEPSPDCPRCPRLVAFRHELRAQYPDWGNAPVRSFGDLEARLQTLYDPYYLALEGLLTRLRDDYGRALLLDGHTGSPRRMKDHQVIIGTRHDTTCAPELARTVATIFTRHGFEVHANVSGYAGGNIVTTYGQPGTRRVHALQLEVNASLLMATGRDEFIAQVSRGEIPEKAEANIARVRVCLREVLAALPAVLATVCDGAR